MGNLVIGKTEQADSCGQVAPDCVPKGGAGNHGQYGHIVIEFQSHRLFVGVRALPYYTVHIVYY
jgi:hypothetical protein